MKKKATFDTVAILDFGSQYIQLIARRVREANVFCQIFAYDVSPQELLRNNVKAIILSGGPATVRLTQSPQCHRGIFNLGLPILGICYGMQLTANLLGGKVSISKRREYGKAQLIVDDFSDLYKGINKQTIVWMSHQDKVTRLPAGFKIIAHTSNSKIASFANKQKKTYGVQFHPEVIHTPSGHVILKNFLFRIAGCKPNWTMRSFVHNAIRQIRNTAENKHIICALSGGVDSSVLAMLLHKAVGKNLTCIFIDNGLLRKDEAEEVLDRFKRHYCINLRFINAEKDFLNKLKGITNPERKRKIIGHEFIRIFEKDGKGVRGIKFLAQGTLYPDVIESRSFKGGPSAMIKTHHNVGGLPKKMHLKLIEPLRELFKDEVRLLGKELGLPDEVIYRHPFPGPGLAVRIIGQITKDRLDILRQADKIFIDEIKKAGLYKQIWQAFCVLLPVKSVGVMGDERTYENVVALRAVTSTDGMTANWFNFPNEALAYISSRIINEVKGVNRVVYDISSKPPSTIEWE